MIKVATRRAVLKAARICQLYADCWARRDWTPCPELTDLASDAINYTDGATAVYRSLYVSAAEAAAMLYNDELPPGWEHA